MSTPRKRGSISRCHPRLGSRGSIMPPDSYKKLLSYSFRLLASKSYTEAEIVERLNRRAKKLTIPAPTVIPASASADEIIKRVVARLRELKYLDDHKILEDFFEYRLKSRPVGKYLFLHQMHRRGISFETASTEWEKRNIEERSLATALMEKRLQELKKQDPGAPLVLRKKRLAQFLASRGFSAETVWACTSEASALSGSKFSLGEEITG